MSAGIVPPEVSDKVSRILDVADFHGIQQDGEGGSMQLWNLRKPIPGHPKGSTVTRQTLDRWLDEVHRRQHADQVDEQRTEGRTHEPRRLNHHD